MSSSATAANRQAISRDSSKRSAHRRWNISPFAKAILEAAYDINSTPNADQKAALACQVHATVRQVQVWFQNRRQRSLAKTEIHTSLPSTPTSLVAPLPPTQAMLVPLPPTQTALLSHVHTAPYHFIALDAGPPPVPSTPSTAAVLQAPPTPPPATPNTSHSFGMRRNATVDSLADLADVAECVGNIEQAVSSFATLTAGQRAGSLNNLTQLTQSLSRVSSYKDLGSMSRVCSLADFSAMLTSATS